MLLAKPFEVIPADRLSDQLWYDDPPLGRGALHIQVSRLRRDLAGTGASPITTVDSGYRFDCEPSDVDWLLFVDLVRSARERAPHSQADAVELFQRGLALWTATAFDDAVGVAMVDEQARMLDGLRRSATLEVSALLAELGRHGEIVAAVAPVLHLTPYDEVIAAESIQALSRLGQFADAVEAGNRTVKALRDDLAVAPAPWFAEMLDGLRDLPSDGPVWTPTREPIAGLPTLRRSVLPTPMAAIGFLGRAGEIACIVEAAGRASNTFVEISAPGGMGKTRLVLEAARHLAERGALVRFGRGDAARRLAAVATHELFAEHVVGSVASVGGYDDGLTAHDVAERLVTDIMVALPQQPLVIVVDDLHLVDTIDRLVLDRLLGESRPGSPLIVVATTRRSGVLLRAPDVRITLGGLPAEAIEEVVGDARVASHLVEVTNGQPLLVAPLVARLLHVPMEERRSAAVQWGKGSDGLGLEGVVAQQLAGCSPRAASLLAGLAIAGTAVGPVVVKALVDGDEAVTAAALIELVEAGLASEDSAGFVSVAHELLGEVMRRSVPGEVDERVRRVLTKVRTMEEVWVPSTGAAVASVGHVTMLLAAAREALRSAAFDQARSVGELVLSFPSTPALEAAASLVVGAACAALEDRDAADAHFTVALVAGRSLHDDVVVVDAVVGLLGSWNGGDGPNERDRTLMESALGEVRDSSARCRLLSRAVGLNLGRGSQCEAWAEEAIMLATGLNDPVAFAVAATALGYAGLGRVGLQRRQELLARACRSAPLDLGFDRWVALLSQQFVAACEANDVDGAASSLERHHRISQGTRRPVHVWRSMVLSGTFHMLRSELDDARQAIDSAAATARQHGLVDGRATELLQRAVLAVHGGPLPSFVERGVRLGAVTPHPLTLALDAVLYSELDPAGSVASLIAAADALAAIELDYLSTASAAAVVTAAELIGRDDLAVLAVERLRRCDVKVPVIAIGTAVLPLPQGLLSLR